LAAFVLTASAENAILGRQQERRGGATRDWSDGGVTTDTDFRAPNQPVIQPERFAEALHLRLQDLATLAGVHRSTVTETPANARLQGFLREALRALSAAYELTHDRDRSIFWFRNSPIPEFGHRTAEQLVAEGKTEAIVSYLTSIAAGSSG
jgi:hypothetical protein